MTFKSFIKTCETWHNFYKYEETTHGVHHVDDHFFIGLDVCLHLTSLLTRHITISPALDLMRDDLKHTNEKVDYQIHTFPCPV